MSDNKITLDFPKVVVIELPKDKKVTPFAGLTENIVKQIQEASYRGVVNKAGEWLINPGFALTKLDVGKYKIIHNIGYANTSINITPLEAPGTVRVTEFNPLSFTVETTVDGKPADRGFAFTLTMVISPPR